jgi:hypothetical protein
MQIIGQHLGEGLRMRCRSPQPPPMVSYLCLVISSAPRKLPRRIRIKSALATSSAGVFNPYIGVPCVCPKKVWHVRHRYSCRPRWLPLRTTCDCEHWGLGQVGNFSLGFLFPSCPLFYHSILASLPIFQPPAREQVELASEHLEDSQRFCGFSGRRFARSRTLLAIT